MGQITLLQGNNTFSYILKVSTFFKPNKIVQSLFYYLTICIWYWNFYAELKCQWVWITKGSRNTRKSAKVVTMSLEGAPPPSASASDSSRVQSWPPPSSDSLGVRTWLSIVSVIHRCFSSEGHQIRGVTYNMCCFDFLTPPPFII